ncbi:YfaP family protein [Rhodohalobacter sp. 8-1]|uniref:YfaP family protein n=1 Tax=Rhodohalobacter sp. 8-1 TaxID=3131972 RepID=UPI0030ECC5B1
MNNLNFHSKVHATILILLFIGFHTGCGSVNSNDEADNSNDEIVNPANADGLAEVLIMPTGTEQRDDNPPAPTGTSDSPIASNAIDQVTSSNGSTAPINFEFDNLSGYLAGFYLQVEGASSYFDIPFIGNSVSGGDLQIPLGIPSNVGEGEFCVNFCIYDSENRVSNVVTTCVDVLRLGTGALQLSLSWDNTSDLDLHVTDPSGTTINYIYPSSSTGGELDRDDVDGFGPENIFWTDDAPDGTYVVEVDHYSGESPTNFIVTITGPNQSRSFNGSATSENRVQVASFTKSGSTLSF